MAAEVEMDKIRPNIRIEIPNNLTENEVMEVDPDDNFKSENEEGEIVDDNETMQNNFISTAAEPIALWTKPRDTFTTGINIFDKAEQEKLQERAKRFALKPNEIHNFTDADLEELYESLGITDECKNTVRFSAVHVLGITNLSAEDILEYFVKYAPTAIEWISEDSCNVTWLEDISAARAMFYASKAVRGMPARESCNTFVKEFLDDIEEPEENTGQSVLLRNKNRIVELKIEETPSKINLENSADISEITIPIPPGYWRLGEKHPKTKCLLLRFALKTDKKPYRVELLGKYYRNLGLSRGTNLEDKKEIRGIFDRNREMYPEKNPWGSLARNWNRDARFCERERELNEDEIPVEIKNPSIRVRLGTKKQDVTEEKQESIEEVQDGDFGDIEKKKSKIPRMRMYADEEEEKIKRKKLLQTLKKQTEKLSKSDDFDKRDLRNVLGITNSKRTMVSDIVSQESVDLGTRLKNRTKNMVFTVARDVVDLEEYDRKENVQSDIRSLIERRRARSPVYSRRKSPEHWSPERKPSEYRDYRRGGLRRSRSPVRKRSPIERRRSPVHRRRHHEGTLHSDRMDYDRSQRHKHRLRNSYHSEDETTTSKPKSKIAVVIKTQKKPTVASTIWSRVQPHSESESESSSGSDSSKSEEGSSSSEESGSESGEESSSSESTAKQVSRPGFRNIRQKISEKIVYRSPLKITMTNDHFKK